VPYGRPYGDMAGRTLTWKVIVHLVDVAQWLDSLWPNHVLSCGSGKILNDSPRTKFQKKNRGGSAKYKKTLSNLAPERTITTTAKVGGYIVC
jgi:hypothetical protein